MVETNTFLFACALTALLCAAGTNALECYSCSSLSNGNCADEFSSSNVATDTECTACLKSKVKDVVTRTCGTGPSGCTDVEFLGIKTSTCICTDALCNGGNHVTITMGAMLLGTAVVLLKAFF
ncbi:lymphocyte antigen 6A-2/6E-1-like [Dreissena polymorpha]|uniref:Protein sleepless n=1 Tax=Dreissena polymorpha TaxID=45954 RepID=A0A9D3YXJ6_DREPO|nr:lymphocyte antigen 6A-2/6E-1-like [Dreissena polymorpha]KAH3709185.1 hypothetical protein DPMN_068647 [Dreissena polymorpha]